jgi:predicted DNA binding CopG/RHH family protein
METKIEISIADEQALLDSYDHDEWRSVGSLQSEIQRYQAYAAAMVERNGQINISLPPKDVEDIRRKAFEAGMPLHLYIRNILHQVASGQLNVNLSVKA